MRRGLGCAVFFLLGLLISLALNGAGETLTQEVYQAEDIAVSIDINTHEFIKLDALARVRYEFTPALRGISLVFHARARSEEGRLYRVRISDGETDWERELYFRPGEDYAYTELPAGEMSALEMDEVVLAVADTIELHTEAAKLREVRQPFRTGRFCVFLLLLSLLTGGLWLADARWRVFARCAAWVRPPYRTEHLFAGLALGLGTVLILLMPVGHGGWDTDMHYRYALQASGLGSRIASLSEVLLMRGAEESIITEDAGINRLRANELAVHDGRYAGSAEGAVYLTHLPSGIGLALGRMLRLGFRGRFCLGEWCNLLLYTLLGFLAIRRLHSGKWLLLLIALLPTDLFLASTYGYDYWVLGFSWLGVATFAGMRQEGDAPARAGDVCVMAASLSLACLMKQNYLPLTLLPYLMPRSKKKHPLRYDLICLVPVLLLAVSLLLRTQTVAATGGDLRGGSGVNAAEQLKSYVLGAPLPFLRLLGEKTLRRLSPLYLAGAVANYANYGESPYPALSLLLLVLIAGAAFADREACDAGLRGGWLKAYMILLYIGGTALILAAFYLVYTPVGADEILGVQARYLLPFLYPLLTVIGTRGLTVFREHPGVRRGYLITALAAELALLVLTAAMQIGAKL